MTTLAPELAPTKAQNATQGSSSSTTGKGKESADTKAETNATVDTESPLAKVVKDSSKITAECQHGLMYVVHSTQPFPPFDKVEAD